jgi:hypothetical protein
MEDRRMFDSQFLLIALGIVAVFVLLALWFRMMMRRLAVLWTPNTKLVKGTFSRFRAKLSGTYQDRPVMAYLGNEGGGGPDDFGPKTYSYTVRMTVPPGAEDWAVVFSVARKGEPPAWNLRAKPAPAERLKTAGLLTAVEGAPRNWRLRYRAGSGRLEISIAGVGMYFCPDLGTFQAQLDLLSRLASITHDAAAPGLRPAV